MKYIKQLLIIVLVAWWSIPLASFMWVIMWMFEFNAQKRIYEDIIKDHWVI